MPDHATESVRAAPALALLIAATLILPACGGGGGGGGTPDTATYSPLAPHVAGAARYRDENRNGLCDGGDTIIVPFDKNVVVNGTSVQAFDLPVFCDSAGSLPEIIAGPAPNEVTLRLGSGPSLRVRGTFQQGGTDYNRPSGIDVSGSLMPDMIESATDGYDAEPGVPIDIVPDMVGSNTVLASGRASCLALADLDGDGDIDLVTGNRNGDNSVWANTGNGAFSDSGQTPGAGDTRAILLADLDGDGDSDLFVGNHGADSEIWENRGRGVFRRTGQAIRTGGTTCAVLGDLDRDGDLDLVVGHDDQPCGFWSNGGGGLFTESSQVLGGGGTTSLALGDVDGDGDDDLVVAKENAPNEVWLNDRHGQFTDTGQAINDLMTTSLALGDIDGDGDLDLVAGNRTGYCTTWSNDGTGTYSYSGTVTGGEFGPCDLPPGEPSGYAYLLETRSVALCDVDGDAALDIVVGNDLAADHVWFNNGDGTFSAKAIAFCPHETACLALADVDGDGDPDCVSVGEGRGTTIFFNSLSGAWGKAGFRDGEDLLGYERTFSIATGDLNGDGRTDFVCGNYESRNTAWIAKEGGAPVSFTERPISPETERTHSIALGDLDGDGDLDVVSGNFNEANRLAFNDGTGSFPGTAAFGGGGTATTSVAVGDLDGDGDLDIYEGTIGQFNLIWYNDGQGNFTSKSHSVGDNTIFVALGDLDGDGDLDCAEADQSIGLRALINNGAGYFGRRLLNYDISRAVALGDVDGDGDLDIFQGREGLADKIWLNDGEARFTDSGQLLSANLDRTFQLLPADIDCDGDIDLTTVCYGVGYQGEPNCLWLNDGSGTFRINNTSIGSNWTFCGALADMDRDGDLDFLAGNDTFTNVLWNNH